MKALLFGFVCFSFCCFSIQSQAQFFKKLSDKLEKSVEKLDKTKSGREETVKLSEKESEENKAKETQQAGWPIGSQQASAKNKQALPENYQLELSGSGPDLYLEYQVIMEGKSFEHNQMDMSMKMYASPSKGGGRSEMVMTMPVIGEMSMVTLTDFKDPTHVIILNERKKQYSVIDFSGLEDRKSEDNYSVTKLGEEKLHGLHCMHARAVDQDGQAFDLWTTKEVPGYEAMMELYSKSQKMGSGNLWKALQEADCAGFMVKLKVAIEGGSSIMELTKLENTEVPQSMLQVPSGYEKKNGGWVKRYMKQLQR